MKTKKLLWLFAAAVVLLIVLLAYLFRPMTMNDIYDEPHFTGVVTQATDQSILVAVDEGQDILRSSDLVDVSLDVKLGDSMTHFGVGDEVTVYYDGTVAESYPAQVHTVYAILLTQASEGANAQGTAADRIPMVMVGGRLYCDTGRESDIDGRCGVMDGTITDAVEPTQVPSQDDQSNFGTGYEYQIIDETGIDIFINEAWFRFEVKE